MEIIFENDISWIKNSYKMRLSSKKKGKIGRSYNKIEEEHDDLIQEVGLMLNWLSNKSTYWKYTFNY